MGERVFLAGLSGAGKTAVAERIAAWLGWAAGDVDREVERQAGRSVAELWAAEGEPAFRREERAAVARLIARPGPGVIALGGGTLEDPGSREGLAGWGTGVFVDAPPETLAARSGANGGAVGRPLLAGRDRLAALRQMAADRGPRFAALPHRVDATGPIEAVAVEVLRALGGPPPAPVAPGVWLGRGALAHAGSLLAEACPEAPGGEAVVATDARVWGLHGSALAGGMSPTGTRLRPCLLAAGEAAKTPGGLESLWGALADAAADRDQPFLVLGGGAAIDVGGLAAATWKRGVPLALFPTTLLAQVDAAIGGKNAIDLAGVKNLVGTFHMPVLVALDPLCLLTLSEREYRSGWAEVVKAGVIGDPDLLALCEARSGEIAERRLDVIEEALGRAVRVKAEIVAADPREAGHRGILNLGHTLGHAIESVGEGRWTHGEAVAIGIVAETRLAESRGIARPGLAVRIAAALAGLGLPTGIPPDLPTVALLAAMRHDKKRRGGVLHLALPVRPGETVLEAVDPAALGEWLG